MVTELCRCVPRVNDKPDLVAVWRDPKRKALNLSSSSIDELEENAFGRRLVYAHLRK